jgi:8-oxo-dGTP diphosphatase
MTRYVAGFLFSEDERKVAMVLKSKPAWQAGLYNGIGGKIEPGESAPEAMRREFIEETGVDVNWLFFTNLMGPDWSVAFFYAKSDRVFDVRTMESEEIHVLDVRALPDNVIANCRWLIPMVLDRSFSPGPHMCCS